MDRADAHERRPPPCQGEGRLFESRLPLRWGISREIGTSEPSRITISSDERALWVLGALARKVGHIWHLWVVGTANPPAGIRRSAPLRHVVSGPDQVVPWAGCQRPTTPGLTTASTLPTRPSVLERSDLVVIPGFISHVELAWEDEALSNALGRLGTFSRRRYHRARRQHCGEDRRVGSAKRSPSLEDCDRTHRGIGLESVDRGEFELKGVPGRWNVLPQHADERADDDLIVGVPVHRR